MMMQTFPTDIQPHGTVPVPAEWGNQVGSVLNQVQGGLHQVTVTGAQTVPVVNGHMYEVNATSTAQVTLTGDPGTQVGVVWAGASGTVAGSPIVDGATVVAVRLTAGWRVYPVGAAVVDTTPPTAGTLTVAVTSSTATLTATGAMDDVALHAQAYSFSKDNGATWTAWQSAASYEFTGLASSTAFSFQHRVRDAAGNIKTGTVVVKSTDVSRSWVVRSLIDFNVADGTVSTAVAPVQGDIQLGSKIPFLGSTHPTPGCPVLGGKLSTPARAVQTETYQSWFLTTQKDAGHRVTIDYAFGETELHNPTIGIGCAFQITGAGLDGCDLWLQKTGAAVRVFADNITLTAEPGVDLAAQPLSGTLQHEVTGSTCRVSINGVLIATGTIKNNYVLVGRGMSLGTQNAFATIDNAKFEALQ